MKFKIGDTVYLSPDLKDNLYRADKQFKVNEIKDGKYQLEDENDVLDWVLFSEKDLVSEQPKSDEPEIIKHDKPVYILEDLGQSKDIYSIFDSLEEIEEYLEESVPPIQKYGEPQIVDWVSNDLRVIYFPQEVDSWYYNYGFSEFTGEVQVGNYTIYEESGSTPEIFDEELYEQMQEDYG